MTKQSDNQEEIGVLLMTTIALLDVAKGKLHPMVDSVGVLSVTVDEIKGHLTSPISDPKRALVRVQQKALDDLRKASAMLREVSDGIDSLVEGIEQEMAKQDEEEKP